MDITGNNYYGIIYVPESASYKDIIIEYNKITYNGPQISFHPTGLTRSINSNISINNTFLTNGGEVAECNKLEIGGNITITHNSKENFAFWFRNSNPSLTILENANLTINQTTYRRSYAVYQTINENASLTIINEHPSITTSNYNIYFLTTASEFILNNPKKIILSNTQYTQIVQQNLILTFQE